MAEERPGGGGRGREGDRAGGHPDKRSFSPPQLLRVCQVTREAVSYELPDMRASSKSIFGNADSIGTISVSRACTYHTATPASQLPPTPMLLFFVFFSLGNK